MNTSIAMKRKRIQLAKERRAARTGFLRLCSQTVMMLLCAPIIVALAESEFNVVQNFSFLNLLICALPVITFLLVFGAMIKDLDK